MAVPPSVGDYAEVIADAVVDDGWIRPPVKVGQKVYIVGESTQRIVECAVIGYWVIEGVCAVITDHGTIYSLFYDKAVFLTREQAEAKLKEGGER